MNKDRVYYKELGLIFGSGAIKKVIPNPKDIKAIKEALKLLRKKFYRSQKGLLASNEFIAIMPWSKNDIKKEWFFVCESLPTLYDPYTKLVSKIIIKKYPDLKFDFKMNTNLIDKKNSTIFKL